MLHHFDLQQLSIPEQLLVHSGAYLDSAEILCERLSANTGRRNYAHGAVLISSAFHSLELIFKAGILQAAPDEKFTGRSGHDLNTLSKRFFKLYPKKEFQFEVPFRREDVEIVDGLDAGELAEVRAFASRYRMRIPEDQRHRYPVDVGGKEWKGLFSFEANSFLVTLKELQSVYARLVPLLKKG